jgi:hypothetical protein
MHGASGATASTPLSRRSVVATVVFSFDDLVVVVVAAVPSDSVVQVVVVVAAASPLDSVVQVVVTAAVASDSVVLVVVAAAVSSDSVVLVVAAGGGWLADDELVVVVVARSSATHVANIAEVELQARLKRATIDAYRLVRGIDGNSQAPKSIGSLVYGSPLRYGSKVVRYKGASPLRICSTTDRGRR